jgi:hypothetical protein
VRRCHDERIPYTLDAEPGYRYRITSKINFQAILAALPAKIVKTKKLREFTV